MTAVMEPSDRGLPPGICARALQAADLTAATALSEEAGWNQVEADWRIFLEFGNAIGLARGQGRLIATAATLPYGDRFAWISMVLVTAMERRQGLAQWLLQQSIETLLERNLIPALDATPAGRRVYSTIGFRDCWTMRRLVGHDIYLANAVINRTDVTVRGLKLSDWPQIIAYDTAVFGAERGVLLRRLAERLPAAALVAERHGRIVGFLFGRDGRVMSQLGPLAAENEALAGMLLARAIAAVRAPLAIDVPDHHATLGHWLAKIGFTSERPLTRMVYGRSAPFDDGTRLFAIAGPEFG